MEVCPDVAKQLLEMLIHAFQRSTELKEHILSIVGVFVSKYFYLMIVAFVNGDLDLAASPESLPRLLEK